MKTSLRTMSIDGTKLIVIKEVMVSDLYINKSLICFSCFHLT